MLCCRSTCQYSPEMLEQTEVMIEANKLVSKDALIERFVDLPDLLARVEDDRELLAELFAMFQKEVPVLQAALHDAINSGDLPQTATVAHTLKGMLANMSMKQGASLAASIEAAARSGNESAIKVTLVAFDSEIAAVSTAVDAFVAG
jgi:two-component system, sensor histidine kinase and response regulator